MQERKYSQARTTLKIVLTSVSRDYPKLWNRIKVLNIQCGNQKLVIKIDDKSDFCKQKIIYLKGGIELDATG